MPCRISESIITRYTFCRSERIKIKLDFRPTAAIRQMILEGLRRLLASPKPREAVPLQPAQRVLRRYRDLRLPRAIEVAETSILCDTQRVVDNQSGRASTQDEPS